MLVHFKQSGDVVHHTKGRRGPGMGMGRLLLVKIERYKRNLGLSHPCRADLRGIGS